MNIGRMWPWGGHENGRAPADVFVRAVLARAVRQWSRVQSPSNARIFVWVSVHKPQRIVTTVWDR